ERGSGFGHEPEYRLRFPAPADAVMAAAEELVTDPVVKLLVRHPELDSDELMAKARAVVGELAAVTHSSADGLVEIADAGVSKAVALQDLAAERELGADDVIAFGDMPNDLPLLEWAGWGVAVANAHPDVRELADEVTASNDDDGVAQVLERLVHGTGVPCLW